MKSKRIDLMEEYILKQKSVSMDALCEQFEVSKNTVRRDVESLLEKGSIRKVYGGVTAAPPPFIPGLLSYDERHTQHEKEKDAICRLAANHVQQDDTIYIDTGTTCLNLIPYIADKKCTILTNSLQVFFKAVPYGNLTVISLPGILKRETLSFVGMEISHYLKTYNIKKAFMTCIGVSIQNGLTNASMEEYTVKKAVIENSMSHFLLADHSKFDSFSLMTYCDLEDIQHIITDQKLEAEYQEFCREHAVSVSVADI